MSLLLASHSSFLFKNPNTTKLHFSTLHPLKPPALSFSLLPSPPSNPRRIRLSSICFSSSNFSGDLPDPPSFKPPSEEPENDEVSDNASPSTFVDEWGEKAEPEAKPSTKLSDSDPPKDEDEWGGVGVESGNGSAGVEVSGADDKLWELKKALVDTVYDNDFGFRASLEVRAEALELVTQLEAANPTPAPTEAVEVLDGNWVLLYTAFSELLPLLAVGTIPLLKVERICQEINTGSLTIENSITLSSPVASFSFSASASFEVRSPSRIQVQFKEGTLKPPEIKSSVDLPESIDLFGQKINLSPARQVVNPLQDAVAGIARSISGQSPLKIPIPGERAASWLLVTYLDKDLRISRGDGGLFVLAKEGSPLLDQ
ncbi:unnamed protein product [Ilex paraguariensis]|uniref:Plastid lipid-associated protein/fibrillin conserved domain-containing protein n=1 Tax=Ilex paraguariensis TaxID=185542 RepID=A0ABC8V206_9AQUA